MELSQRQRRFGALLTAALVLLAVPFVAFAISNGVLVSGTVPLDADDGPQVDVEFDGDTEMDLGNAIPDDNTVHVITEDGEVVFSSVGQTDATIHTSNITGGYTSITALDVSTNALTINPGDKSEITISGDATRIEFRDATVDDGTADFVYAGTSGSTTITLSGLPTSETLGAVDQDGNLLAVETADSTGTVTYSNLDTDGETSVQLVTSGGGPTVSDLEPEGEIESPPNEISANVTDPDFPADNVSVTFTLDGDQIDTQYIESDQRVSASIPESGKTGGTHTYSIEAEDEYGQTDIASSSYSIPDTLYIRNESDTSELVDGTMDVEVTFFGDDQIFSRTATGGTVDMEGLPVDQNFIVEIEASQDYHGRTVFIKSIFEQQDVYLLPETADSISSRFILEDPTGQFDSETILYIQKPINQSGSVEYRSVVADRFGSEGVTGVLETGSRYRLVVESSAGVTQDIGPYRADESETVTVRPGTPSIQLDEYEDGWGADAKIDNTTIEYVFEDPEELTDRVTISIHEKNNESNQLGNERTYHNPVDVSGTYALTQNESDLTWVANFEVDRGGETFTVRKELANRPNLVPAIGDSWRLVIGIGIMFVSAGIFSMLNAGVGGVVVAIQGGLLWYTGWLGGATTGAAVVIALFIAVTMHIYRTSGP